VSWRAQIRLGCAAAAIALAAEACGGQASLRPDPDEFRLTVPADEVSLTFQATDAHGLAVSDLKADEFQLRDDGKPPRRILAFTSLQDAPIRAGILLDTSESMLRDIAGNRAIANRYALQLMRQDTDRTFVMDFGFGSNLRQDWTSSGAVLSTAIRSVAPGSANPLRGTAVIDAVFRACYYGFGKIDHAASGNFILLFSDGEDNASHTSLAEAVDACQKANTAIYAFRPAPQGANHSTGPQMLAELASKTGGRVFHADESEAEADRDLRTIVAEVRNGYRLVYKPAELKHDGAFHSIELIGPDRVARIHVRSGYYAPER
jgi:Ca-activated chloride channel family protein